MNPKFDELRNRLMEIHDLSSAGYVLWWDQMTMMPPKGAQARAEQLATLARTEHEKLTSPDIVRLLEELRPYEESLPYDSTDASLIRVARREQQKQLPVPAELRADMRRTASMSRQAWAEARQESNFKIFLPHLEKTIELRRKYVACFEPADNPYDILLDDYEPGLKTAEVQRIFGALKRDLVPLISSISSHADVVDDRCLHGHFPIERQREFCLSILSRLGFNPDSWRLDPAINPSTVSIAINDNRITTKYPCDFISPSAFFSMHECGHGLDFNGRDAALERTLLRGFASYAWGESQSRLWENLVGRSGAFWKYFYPRLQATFPEQFNSIDIGTFYRAINKAEPSFIRAEADEATYGLHIILRFELEQEMMQGKLPLRDLPEAWNAKMKGYLGVDVPDDAHGVLQDSHWGAGNIGYFPTYELGNIIGAQLWEKVIAEIPDLYAQFERGEFQPLRAWLTEHVCKHGRKFTPQEMCQRVFGGPIDVAPFIRYLKKKYGEIYGI